MLVSLRHSGTEAARRADTYPVADPQRIKEKMLSSAALGACERHRLSELIGKKRVLDQRGIL